MENVFKSKSVMKVALERSLIICIQFLFEVRPLQIIKLEFIAYFQGEIA